MVTTDWLQRTRRNRRWRLWVHGVRIFGLSIPTGVALGEAGKHGLLPNAVAVPAFFAVFLAGLVGLIIAMFGMLSVSRGDSAMFNAYRTDVFTALIKDLVSPHAPPPLVEKPWPPQMWHGTGEPSDRRFQPGGWGDDQ